MATLVNWYEFQKKIKAKSLLVFSNTDIRRLFGSSLVGANFLLTRYAKKGFITRLKQGLYVLSDVVPTDFTLANTLYKPSYVSLEFALSYHQIIPEQVYEITSVTPKSTRRFEALGKIYSYRKIKKEAYTGYSVQKQNGISFYIATPEKAFVDLNYFRMLDGLEPLTRFNKEKLEISKALHDAALFKNKKLETIIRRSLQ